MKDGIGNRSGIPRARAEGIRKKEENTNKKEKEGEETKPKTRRRKNYWTGNKKREKWLSTHGTQRKSNIGQTGSES